MQKRRMKAFGVLSLHANTDQACDHLVTPFYDESMLQFYSYVLIFLLPAQNKRSSVHVLYIVLVPSKIQL